MHSRLYRFFNTKISAILVLIATCLLTQTSEAARWGKNEQIVELEGVQWNEVCFDTNELYFLAYIPNYSGTAFRNGVVSLNGVIEGTIGYVITSSASPGFSPPNSVDELVEMIQEDNPSYLVQAVDSQKLGVNYAVDMIPTNQEDTAFWRYLVTNAHLIQMGTDDPNENRRVYFFDSLNLSSSP